MTTLTTFEKQLLMLEHAAYFKPKKQVMRVRRPRPIKQRPFMTARERYLFR